MVEVVVVSIVKPSVVVIPKKEAAIVGVVILVGAGGIAGVCSA